MRLGPDAARYWCAAGGAPVPRPFHLRVALPWLCGQDPFRWWVAWSSGWVLAAAGMFSWALAVGSWQVAAAATGLLLGLSGFLGPSATIPVGVDIPATGLALCGVALFAHGWQVPGVAIIAMSALIRETTPVWSALWLWSPLPLVALAVPLIIGLVRKPGPDPLSAQFQHIADHPIRSALEHHAGRWRDGWLMVAPWGVTIAALLAPSWPLALLLVLTYLQLLIATDTVRLLHHAAGPLMALTAAQVIPAQWLLIAVAVHVVWWRKPERI
jgi:hypothetical protein